MNPTEFRKQVKDAFEHLYDTAYLGAHPLVPELVRMPDGTRAARAQKLRSILKEAIEAIRPQQDLPSTAPEWRTYNALRFRYTQGMTMAQVENALGISQRQLQRDFHKGLDGVTLFLEELRVMGGETNHAPALDGTNEIQVLRNEMNDWQLVREPVQVADLVESAQKMLQPLVREHAYRFRIELPPSLKPVLVDSTLTRQALFQILRLLFQAKHENEIKVWATARAHRVSIYLISETDVNTTASDWQIAQVLIERQGGTCTCEPGSDGAEQVVVTLLQANPPRVLVVDDNQAIHDLFERYLAPNFYEVVHAYQGADATTTALETQPDVILLDVMMPTMDGWQVLQELQADRRTWSIPIVICSVLNEPELAFSLGARAYLKKPVERLELLAALARLGQSDRAAANP